MHTRVHLTLRAAPDLPVEAEQLLPVNVTGKTGEEIAALPLQVGNRTETVGEHFEVEITSAPEQAEDDRPDALAELVLTGDLARFKRLGEAMTAGTMRVEGSVGFHAGALMHGGELTITGNAADHLGAMMTGGTIRVLGNAGHFVGSAYRGETRGMNGGTILIHGNAGNLTGARMRRGTIAVGGKCGDLAGFSMGAGTIVIGGETGVRAGANMVRGSVILLTNPGKMPPTFRYNHTGQLGFWPILLGALNSGSNGGKPLLDGSANAAFQRYSGDFNEGGRGEILIAASAN
ncbi:MAG: formylmethanofuran dehydrogenase subunit C [Desulfovibrionaceae bacterium]